MYLRQSQSEAFHGTGKVVTYSLPNHELQIASVVPQGMKVLLMGIGTSTTTTPTVPISWHTQLEQTTLGTKWQMQLHIRGETSQIREVITMGTALTVSNGSFQNVAHMPG